MDVLCSELSKLEAELDNRLSFPWMTPQPVTREKLAYVDGRDRSTTEPLLRPAKALGIGMIVLDTKPSILGSISCHSTCQRDHRELQEAVDRVFNSQYGHMTNVNAVSVEPYCDGPEIDANFVLQDGEVLFVECADDFPKAGDREEAAASTVFKDSAVLYPSGLPAAELEMVQRSLHQTLLRFGFRSGAFHVEARVRDSSMRYGVSDGVLDLRTAASASLTEAPNSFLIEVNPRLPGLMITRAVHSTYGISYAALHLLIAVRDAERTAALSQPFCAGPQYWRNVVFIAPDKGGIFASDDFGDELKKRCPDLWRSVSSYHCYFEKGQRVPDPTADEAIWFAWVVAYSRVGRRHLLELSERVRAEVRYEML